MFIHALQQRTLATKEQQAARGGCGGGVEVGLCLAVLVHQVGVPHQGVAQRQVLAPHIPLCIVQREVEMRPLLAGHRQARALQPVQCDNLLIHLPPAPHVPR